MLLQKLDWRLPWGMPIGNNEDFDLECSGFGEALDDASTSVCSEV